MPEIDVWVKLRGWVPPSPPGRPPSGWRPGWGHPALPWVPGEGDDMTPPWGIEGPGEPGRPEFPWEPGGPGIGGGPILPGRPTLPPREEWPSLPERPPWERPTVPPPLPIVDADDIGGHPPLPDLDMPGHWGRVGDAGWPAWVVDPGEPPMVEEDYEGRPPRRGHPGTWCTVLTRSGAIAWAWVPSPPEVGNELPDVGVPPEREPRLKHLGHMHRRH